MWWTPDGERILKGAEAQLFREALAMVVDMVRDDNEGLSDFAAPPFDKLQPNQKLALLAYVGSALLREDQPMPNLTAAEEATVGAVFEMIRTMVELDIERPPEDRTSPTCRELVLAACQERGIDNLPDDDSEDLGEWDMLVGCLSDGVLWDEDWKDSESLLDADPRASRAVKAVLGIDRDYYIAVPPDPTQQEMDGICATLRALTQNPAETE